jgi:hypothetical protein
MAGSPIVRASNIRMSRNQPAPCRAHQVPCTHLGWWSITGYTIVATIAVAGFALAFRDLS